MHTTTAGVQLGDLANELKDLAGVVFSLAMATDKDTDTDDDYSATAFVVYYALLDIVGKMNVLSDRVIFVNRELRTLDIDLQLDQHKVWIKVGGSKPEFTHYLVTHDQVDRVREILNREDVPDDYEEKDDAESEKNEV